MCFCTFWPATGSLVKQAMITLWGMAEHRFSNVYNYQCLMWILTFPLIPFPSYLLFIFQKNKVHELQFTKNLYVTTCFITKLHNIMNNHSQETTIDSWTWVCIVPGGIQTRDTHSLSPQADALPTELSWLDVLSAILKLVLTSPALLTWKTWKTWKIWKTWKNWRFKIIPEMQPFQLTTWGC